MSDAEGTAGNLGLLLMVCALVVVILSALLFRRAAAARIVGFRPVWTPVGIVAAFLGFPIFLLGAPPFLVTAPALAFFPALALLVGAVVRFLARGPLKGDRAILLVLAAVPWLLYWGYEQRMRVWSRSVSGAIRVDLVLVLPALYLVSILAIALACAKWRAPTPARSGR